MAYKFYELLKQEVSIVLNKTVDEAGISNAFLNKTDNYGSIEDLNLVTAVKDAENKLRSYMIENSWLVFDYIAMLYLTKPSETEVLYGWWMADYTSWSFSYLKKTFRGAIHPDTRVIFYDLATKKRLKAQHISANIFFRRNEAGTLKSLDYAVVTQQDRLWEDIMAWTMSQVASRSDFLFKPKEMVEQSAFLVVKKPDIDRFLPIQVAGKIIPGYFWFDRRASETRAELGVNLQNSEFAWEPYADLFRYVLRSTLIQSRPHETPSLIAKLGETQGLITAEIGKLKKLRPADTKISFGRNILDGVGWYY